MADSLRHVGSFFKFKLGAWGESVNGCGGVQIAVFSVDGW